MLPATSILDRTENHQRTGRLLIVDDDYTTLALMKRLFMSDYELFTASNGEDALALLEHTAVDTVLLDVNMPRMDGFTCLEIIRRQEATRRLPVIIVSAHSDTRDVVQGLQLGANDFISKPINTQITLARVRTQVQLKRANDEKDEMITRLNQTQEFQNHFYRIVTHDLKAPLTNLRLGHYMLRDLVGQTNDNAHGVLDNMDVAVNSMLEMIHSFLDATEYHQGEFRIQPEPLNAGDHVRRALDQHGPSADRKGIQLTAESCDCVVLADNMMLGQMLDNLVSNAIKFSTADTTVHISAGERSDCVRVSVADQGPGVPPDERERLFEMFGRLTPRPTGQETSTGLGLWIVKTLAAAQGGRVGADFPADGGSIFWFELPKV